MNNLLSRRLTPGERLLLWRRSFGWTQTHAAIHTGFCRQLYSLMELDQHTPMIRTGPTGRLSFRPDIREPLDEAKLLFLARRRSGLTLEEIGKRLNVSRPTVLKWEDRGDARLRAFYKTPSSLKITAAPKGIRVGARVTGPNGYKGRIIAVSGSGKA